MGRLAGGFPLSHRIGWIVSDINFWPNGPSWLPDYSKTLFVPVRRHEDEVLTMVRAGTRVFRTTNRSVQPPRLPG
jgi:hypothetical protein